jgi:ParB-like chromosome segregation protein Spo0J
MLSDEEATFLAMKINEMHGKRLNPMEEGLRMLKFNSPPFNWSEEKIGRMFGRSQQWVSYRIRMARQADQSVLNSITTRVVTLSHAREIVELPREEQREVVDAVSEHKLSSRTTEALVGTWGWCIGRGAPMELVDKRAL